MTARKTLFNAVTQRRWLIALLGVGLALISLVMFQRALAEPPTLKPPFKINHSTEARPFGLNGPEALPLNGTIILSQTFNASYAPVPAGTLGQKGWQEAVGSAAINQYTWMYTTTLPLTDTIWSAGRNPTGKPPLTDTYTNSMEAMLIYGPLNLSEYYQIVLTATFWLDTKPGDFLGLAYSTDGSTWNDLYYASGADPNLTSPQTAIANLSALSGKPVVWIAFIFSSNNDNLNGRGAFLHDVVVRGTPYFRVFLPLVRLDPTPTPTPTKTPTPTPTPTATPGAVRYLYTFTNETATNNPDFNHWGGNRTTSCGTDCNYYQDLVTLTGNPSPAFTLYMQGINGRGGAGPRQNGASLSTATNFEYSADFYVYNGQLNARYGLAFDASSGTFPGGGDPPMDPYVNYYLLELRMDSTTRTKVAQWQFLKVVNGTRESVTSAANLPISINQGQWHNLKVVQKNDGTLSFYLNGQFVKSVAYDTSWSSTRRRFGLYIDVRDSNGDNGPFEFFSDNITVKDLP